MRSPSCSRSTTQKVPWAFPIPSLNQSSIMIVLRNHHTFPEGSNPVTIVAQNTDGYQALHAIMRNCHPRFLPVPEAQVMQWPRQRSSQSIQDFFMHFWDQLQLCLMYHGQTITTIEAIMTTFLIQCRHSEFLLREFYSDIRNPTRQSQLYPRNLVNLVQYWLALPDSPSRNTQTSACTTT